jgi:hypothetical protein
MATGTELDRVAGTNNHGRRALRPWCEKVTFSQANGYRPIVLARYTAVLGDGPEPDAEPGGSGSSAPGGAASLVWRLRRCSRP